MIKSTDREVRALIDALGSDDARREGAVARLTIIGPRAVGRLIEAYRASPDRPTQLAILRVLETTGDHRALAVARDGLAAGGDLAVQSVAVLQELLTRASLPVQAEALDALVAAAAGRETERRVRLAASQAVDEISRTISPESGGCTEQSITPSEAVWADAADGHLPDDPATLRSAAAEQAERAPLPVVHHVLEFVRAREEMIGRSHSADAVARRQQWRAVRGALHQVLALRGSRIALYDLREALAESRDPLPQSFVAALQIVGDGSCLEPLATAFARTPEDQGAWRHQLSTAFHTVAKRERLTRKHSAMRRALALSPELAS